MTPELRDLIGYAWSIDRLTGEAVREDGVRSPPPPRPVFDREVARLRCNFTGYEVTVVNLAE